MDQGISKMSHDEEIESAAMLSILNDQAEQNPDACPHARSPIPAYACVPVTRHHLMCPF